MLPLYDADGKLITLQYIDQKGVKRYHDGGPTGGGRYWVLGKVNKTIYLAEGFATAASIHEATGDAVYLAYSAGNLINVAGIIREKHGPTADVVIVADNDESGTGQSPASETAQRWGMRVVIPPVQGDANDYVQSGHDLLALLKPKLSSDWLISADVFSSLSISHNPPPSLTFPRIQCRLRQRLLLSKSTTSYDGSPQQISFFAKSAGHSLPPIFNFLYSHLLIHLIIFLSSFFVYRFQARLK